MTSSIQQRVVELQYFENSIKYATTVLAKVLSPYGHRYDVKRTTNGDWEARQQGMEGMPGGFPLISVVVSRFEDSKDFMWNQQALFNGFTIKSPNNIGIINRLKLKYQKVTLQVTIETESGEEFVGMGKRWKFRERKAQFIVTDPCGFSVTCKYLFQDDFSVPEQQVTEKGTLFSSSTSATLYTYVGERIEYPAIKEIDTTLENLSPNGVVLEKITLQRRRIR